jgi:serine/threonine protein kinase/tetratricopeptide (TPR) repeat protein
MTDTALDALRAALGAQYDVLRQLGQGGMGSVYLARDRTLDREVAVKVINSEVASNASLRERFLLEARTVAKLRHPGIVSVFAAGETNGLLYFVMEFVPGESLRERLVREQRLSSAEGTRIIREIALALHYAHAQGLIHRDVKPENILLDSETGRAMLTDFGVARALEAGGNITGTGMILGSPRYMSPEQASGDHTLDGRSDLYALALVAYECFSGAPAVQAQTAAAMMMKHLTETPTPLGTVATDLPAPLIHAIERGLAKDPAQRWQTGDDFAEALAGRGASAAQPSPAPTGRRRLAGIGAAVAIVSALGIAFLSSGRGGDRASSETSEGNASSYVVAPFEIQSGDPAVTWLREGAVNMLTLTLGQWSDLRVVDYERTLALLDAEDLSDKKLLSIDDAQALARRARAGRVLTGQIQTTRDSLRVIAKLYDARRGEMLEQAEESGALGDDPRPVFDRLARRLLNVAGGPASMVELMQATTTNLTAYRAYLTGVRFLQSWRLPEADSAFRIAIAQDSSFALAYHKRALALGWSEATTPEYIGSATRAFDLAGRLPPRERALVEGHYYLATGLFGGLGVPTAEGMANFEKAIETYAALIASDSLVAEAWYGWADANFHGRNGDNVALLRLRSNNALRGFHRTLAVDSSFHLAYSHLVQLYNQATQPNQGVLIEGDTTILLTSAQALADFGGTPALDRAVASAAARGLEIARAWVRSDPGAAQPIIQLSQSYAQAGLPDSAVAVLRRTRAPSLEQRAAIQFELAKHLLSTADTAIGQFVRETLDSMPPAVMDRVPMFTRFQGVGTLLAAAATTGNFALVDRVAAAFAATDRAIPEMQGLIAWNVGALKLAMGAPTTPANLASLRAAIANIDKMNPAMAGQARYGSLSIVYFATLATRDTEFRSTLERWAGEAALGYIEFDALAALDRGDSATARQLITAFPDPDSIKAARFSYGGMRTIARAEVLARLGLPRQAARMYEASDPRRFNVQSLAEPGYVLWVRSLADRARLWAEVGETQKAISAYEEFLVRWRSADGPAAALRSAAQRELAALKDPPRPR